MMHGLFGASTNTPGNTMWDTLELEVTFYNTLYTIQKLLRRT